MASANLTAARLRELFLYDPTTGVMTWRVARQRIRVGSVAGSANSSGYLLVVVDARQYRVHRLAWLYQTGSWPRFAIDHINGNRSDNRFENLRDVPLSVNSQNQRISQKDKKLGQSLGVGWHVLAGKWIARISVSGKEKHLGLFDTEDAAHEAYLKAKRILHPGCLI